MSIWLAFVCGFLAGELFQLGNWKLGHPDRPWLDYIRGEAIAHWMVNLSVVVVTGVLWVSGAFGPLLAAIGFPPIAQLLSISPPFGFLIAAFSDVVGDKFAFGIMARFSKTTP